MRQTDLIVIGAGILGAFHAYFAAHKGYRTLLLERNAFPNDASVRNFGIISPTIVPVGSEWAGYAFDSLEIYRALQREHDLTVRVSGSLYLASNEIENRALQEFAQRAPAAYRCNYVDAREATGRFPFVQPSYCAGALLFPDDLTVDAPRLLRRLIPRLEATGKVEYVPHTTVVGVTTSSDGCRVTDARGRVYAAARAIVCNGAEYRTLFPEQFASSGLQVCKLQMMRTVPLPEFRLPHAVLGGLSIGRYPAFALSPSYVAVRAQPVPAALGDNGIHVLFKQAPDGSIIVGDSHEYRDCGDVEGLEERSNPAINDAILAYGRLMLRLPSWAIGSMWNGYYLVNPGHDIYTRTIDGAVHIVTGIGGKGMTTGPGYARHSIEALVR
jgi:FAD dependent oxidoreductase TIGR03364